MRIEDIAVILKTYLPRKSCGRFIPPASSSREVWFCWFLHQRILMLWGEAGQGQSPIRLNHLPHRQLWIQVREMLPLWGKQNGKESALIQRLLSH